jgi:predicted ATPase with chaperone activity
MKTKTIVGTSIPTLNILGSYENLSRAIEIAKVGGHTVTLAYYKSIDGDYERDVNPLDCKLVADTYGFTPVIDGDLIVEVVRVQFDYLMSNRKHETLEEINERIATATAFQEVTEFEKYDVCMSLLRTAYDRLNLCTTDVQRIFKVAATIARMAYSPLIRVEHIAEAIQYRSIIRHETAKIYQP